MSSSPPKLRRIAARFWPQIKREKVLIGGASIAMFAEVAFRLLEPWPLKFVFDLVITSTPSGGQSGIGWFDRLDAGTLLWLCAGALIFFVGMRTVSSYLNQVGFALAGNRILTTCRSELFAHLQRLSLTFHNATRTGDLITRVTADIGRLKEVAVTALLPLGIHAVTLVGMMVVMFLMDWRLALVAASIMPAFVFSVRRSSGRIREVARRQRKREGEIGATTAETISSIQIVQSLSLEDVQHGQFARQNRSSLKEGVQGKRLSARLVGTVDILIAAATAVVLLMGARFVRAGEMTPGDLIVFLAYLKNAFKPMRDLAKYSGRIAKAAASAERVVEVLDTTPEIVDDENALDAPPAVERVAFESVTFAYTPERPALQDVDLVATRGTLVALAGPSGAGKSTAMSLVLRLFDPQHGAVTFDGHDIRNYRVDSVRRLIAVVPQENTLFGVSVRDNIAYGAPGATDEAIVAAAHAACAHEFIERLPDGYDTVLGERGATLSEGQRHRIAIARAAIRNSPILVLDEPMTSLDQTNRKLVREAVRGLRRNRITFVIAHDLTLIEDADEILFLEQGRIVERGTHDELLAQGGRYAAMHALQSAQGGQEPSLHALG